MWYCCNTFAQANRVNEGKQVGMSRECKSESRCFQALITAKKNDRLGLDTS
jgi:hypothetical protein